jgi:hypothetical protein
VPRTSTGTRITTRAPSRRFSNLGVSINLIYQHFSDQNGP